MRENLPVVIRVLDAFFKIDKESAGVANAADHKPDRRNKSDDGRNDQRCNEELDRPPFIRPGADCIPNDDCHKDNANLIDERITENGVGNDFIPPRVFVRNADEFTENIAECPVFFRRRRGIRINAAVQKLVKIIRLIGEIGADNIPAERKNH